MWPLIGRLTGSVLPKLTRANPFDDLVRLVSRKPVRSIDAPANPISSTIMSGDDVVREARLADFVDRARVGLFNNIYNYDKRMPGDDLLRMRMLQAKGPLSTTTPIKTAKLYSPTEMGLRTIVPRSPIPGSRGVGNATLWTERGNPMTPIFGQGKALTGHGTIPARVSLGEGVGMPPAYLQRTMGPVEELQHPWWGTL